MELPITLKCDCCGNIIAESFVELNTLPVLYCSPCAAAIALFKNCITNETVYRKDILIKYQGKLNSFAHNGFRIVHMFKHNEKYLLERLLKDKQNENNT